MDATFDFEANNFKIAVGLVSQNGLTPLLNPEIIDFSVYLRKVTNGVRSKTILSTHTCKEEELKSFTKTNQ